jgi:hypothetical protein
MEKRKLGHSSLEFAPIALGGNVFSWTIGKDISQSFWMPLSIRALRSWIPLSATRGGFPATRGRFGNADRQLAQEEPRQA